MSQSVFASHRWRWVGFLLLLSGLVAGPRPAAADDGTGRLSTRYFTIFYPAGEEQTAQWYAGFADDVDSGVSEMLGAEPIAGITLRIYDTEADIPAGQPRGRVAPRDHGPRHPRAQRDRRGRRAAARQPPELARESFRHEMTHIVAGVLTDYNLPIGFDEGLAQYNEGSATTAPRHRPRWCTRPSERAILAVLDGTEQPPPVQPPDGSGLSAELHRVAFLAERYGMGAFGRFLAALKHGRRVPGGAASGLRPADRYVGNAMAGVSARLPERRLAGERPQRL